MTAFDRKAPNMNNQNNAVTAAAADAQKKDTAIGQPEVKTGESQPKIEPKTEAAPASKT